MEHDENVIEAALRVAAADPSKRPDFYKALLEATVYVIGTIERPGSRQTTLGAGEKVSIVKWQSPDGSPTIPFFSSLDALRRALDQEMGYLALPARALFEMTKGASLVLDPRSEYGKEFFPNEIEALLAHGVNQLPETRVTKAATEVLLGQPKDYPTKMVNCLGELFARRQNVKRAYLCLMQDRSRDEKAHLVVGITADGDTAQLIREAGIVAADTAPGGEAVDLTLIEPSQAGLSHYFLESVQPFFKRR